MVIIITSTTLIGCSFGVNKINNEGIAYLKEKQYTNALAKFNEALSKDEKNSNSQSLKGLTESCITLLENYNNNEFTGVIETYDKIKTNPNFSVVSSDIDEKYTIAKKKPKLSLKYLVYGSQEFVDNKYYQDDKGEIVLGSFEREEFMDNAFVIDSTRPSSEVLFEIQNLGIDPAENIVLNLKFNDMAIKFESTNTKWKGVNHLHGLGLWNEVKFTQNEEPLYKDIPIKFTFVFADAMVFSPKANIEVTILAKDCTPRKFTIPVKVKEL